MRHYFMSQFHHIYFLISNFPPSKYILFFSLHFLNFHNLRFFFHLFLVHYLYSVLSFAILIAYSSSNSKKQHDMTYYQQQFLTFDYIPRPNLDMVNMTYNVIPQELCLCFELSNSHGLFISISYSRDIIQKGSSVFIQDMRVFHLTLRLIVWIYKKEERKKMKERLSALFIRLEWTTYIKYYPDKTRQICNG